MRISKVTQFHADGGWRPFSFLKIATDEAVVGWSEFSQGAWAPGLPAVIERLTEQIIGRDPRAFSRLTAELQASVRFAPGGLNQQAVAAIENACVDIAAKAAGIPACALFGGPFRTSIPLYWSHCGTFRVQYPKFFANVLNRPPLESLDDLKRLAREVGERGFLFAKTNPIVFTSQGARLLNPGFVPAGLDLGRNLSRGTLNQIDLQVAAFSDGLAPQASLMLDLNFGFAAEGVGRLAERLRHYGIKWLEVDMHEPTSLAHLRAKARMPIASLETVYGTKAYNAFCRVGAIDIAIVDVVWNGFAESARIAALADAYELNVAPHNFYGPLSDLMAAHFCAAVPNVDVMEIEGDDVPWKYSLLTNPPSIKDGHLQLPTGPGWGADVDEQALAEHGWSGAAPADRSWADSTPAATD